MTIEQDVARHYTHGTLESAVVEGLAAMGHASGALRPEDLAGIDEFHMGGHQATADLAGQLDLRPGMRLLDIGSGLGGTARFLARHYGCHVTGVDLTPEYVAVAEVLTGRVGLADQVAFRVGSALELPFEKAAFDAATLLHVGMNIPDKETLCTEAGRVLKPGGVFAVYDVMRVGDGDLEFPVAWADTPATSFVETPDGYRRALTAAGFAITSERNRHDLAVEFFRRIRERIAKSGPPPLGLHILMGPEAPKKVANMIANLEQGRVAPVEMICRRS